jgi:hypothetical protein
MPEPRNPLRGEGQPRDPMSADQFNNQKVTRRMRVHRPDGTIEDILVSESSSCPDKDGFYVDTEMHHVVTDASGTVIPSDPARINAYSHADLVILNPEEAAVCTSWLHPRNHSRTIRLGHDGRRTATGAICSVCDGRLGTIYIVIFIFCIAVILGIWKGAGLF